MTLSNKSLWNEHIGCVHFHLHNLTLITACFCQLWFYWCTTQINTLSPHVLQNNLSVVVLVWGGVAMSEQQGVFEREYVSWGDMKGGKPSTSLTLCNDVLHSAFPLGASRLSEHIPAPPSIKRLLPPLLQHGPTHSFAPTHSHCFAMPLYLFLLFSPVPCQLVYLQCSDSQDGL